jgi:hypothetical protein
LNSVKIFREIEYDQFNKSILNILLIVNLNKFFRNLFTFMSYIFYNNNLVKNQEKFFTQNTILKQRLNSEVSY